MEYLSGGELYDHVLDHEGLSEVESRHMFSQIVAAIQHCHMVGYRNHSTSCMQGGAVCIFFHWVGGLGVQTKG